MGPRALPAQNEDANDKKPCKYSRAPRNGRAGREEGGRGIQGGRMPWKSPLISTGLSVLNRRAFWTRKKLRHPYERLGTQPDVLGIAADPRPNRGLASKSERKRLTASPVRGLIFCGFRGDRQPGARAFTGTGGYLNLGAFPKVPRVCRRGGGQRTNAGKHGAGSLDTKKSQRLLSEESGDVTQGGRADQDVLKVGSPNEGSGQ